MLKSITTHTIESIASSLSPLQCALFNTHDEFLSEFTAKENNDVFNITGFTGSNGIVIIVNDRGQGAKYLFFTDGRYTIQAQNEIPSSFDVMPISEFVKYLQTIQPHTLFVNFKKISHKFAKNLQNALPQLILTDITELGCGEVSPPFKINNNYYELPNEITGKTKEEKIQELQSFLCQHNKDGFFISNPQSVCWLLNIRGCDENFTPIYKNTLFVSREGYGLSPNPEGIHGAIFIEEDITHFQFNKIGADGEFSNFLTKQKAIKNNAEVQGMIDAHKIDAIAVTKFLLWLEEGYYGKTEWELSQKLLEFRQESPYFRMPSFATICGVNENGAIIHYNPTKENSKTVRENSILLIDSGGQYADLTGKNKILGTTDVTRTVFLGKEPPQEYKKAFTLVLKGHIAIAMEEFDLSIPSKYFDSLARQFLKKHNMDYPHSTGHGVGAFLSVHESGCGFSQNGTETLKEGMVISNEPGFYLQNNFGIRIESLVLVENTQYQNNSKLQGDDEDCKEGEFMSHSLLRKATNGAGCEPFVDENVKNSPKPKLGFQTITLVPIQEKSIDFTLLTQQEVGWVKQYNKKCMENLQNIQI